MIRSRRLFSYLSAMGASIFVVEGVHAAPPEVNAWDEPRPIERFSALLKRSPFSLPTTEESSPLAERFSITGAFLLDGEQVVFVLDRNSLARHRVSTAPNESGLQLVQYLPDPDPRKMRATIRLGDQSATISFKEATATSGGTTPAAAPTANGGAPEMAPAATAPGEMAEAPAATPAQSSRRVIRRTVITGTTPPKP